MKTVQSLTLLGHNSQRTNLEYVDINCLRTNARNPRDHSDRQIRNLAKSIGKFGFIVPIIVDENGCVIAGNARVLAARRLGLTEVPAIKVSHLTAEEKRAFILADNKLADLATWNEEILRQELQFFTDFNIDFDLAVIGFETAEVDIILGDVKSIKDDVLPSARGRTAVTRSGDLWIAGQHRILCGNALLPDSYDVLLAGNHARMVFTDPPYNVPIAGHVGGSGAVKHREFQMASGEMSSPEFTAFLTTAMHNMAKFSANGSLIYVCMDWRHLPEALAAGSDAYSKFLNLCVWAKTNSGMGSLYRSRHELVLVFKNGTAPHVNNVELGRHGRNRSNLWEYAGINSFGSDRDELLAMHPTVKPVALVADAIKDASARGDIILDPFGGVATTAIAAEKAGRRAALMEIDPLYVDVAVRRWQAFTGREAVCARTGATFAQREATSQAPAASTALTTINNNGEKDD